MGATLFNEWAREEQPAGTFTNDAGTYTRTYILTDDTGSPLSRDQLYEALRDLLGYTFKYNDEAPGALGGAGAINRLMPLADPQFPNLFADRVVIKPEIMGDYRGANNRDTFAVQVVDGFSAYRGYRATVTFSHRPYALFDDQRLNRQNVIFFDEKGNRKRLFFYKEWQRFTWAHTGAIGTRISATRESAMHYRTRNQFDDRHNTPFNQIPVMTIPDTQVIINWIGVPQRYVLSFNSYLKKYAGYINQGTFRFLGNDWLTGSALFEGATTVRTYNQAVDFLPVDVTPRHVLGAGGVGAVVDPEDAELQGTFGGNPLVDLELHFVLTDRGSDDTPLDADVLNKNWLTAGHNLMPHFASKTYSYATTGRENDKTTWVPSYLSVPFALLFQDPDTPGIVVNA